MHCVLILLVLYHTKTQKGTKTCVKPTVYSYELYHTKTQKGTKTAVRCEMSKY